MLTVTRTKPLDLLIVQITMSSLYEVPVIQHLHSQGNPLWVMFKVTQTNATGLTQLSNYDHEVLYTKLAVNKSFLKTTYREAGTLARRRNAPGSHGTAGVKGIRSHIPAEREGSIPPHCRIVLRWSFSSKRKDIETHSIGLDLIARA